MTERSGQRHVCPVVAGLGSNHHHALALYFTFYNFVRIHKALPVTPAMAAGVSNRLWSMDDIAAMIDPVAPAPSKRGPYRKKSTASDGYL